MFKIKGKQQFGSVWANGVCIAKFTNGIATIDDPATVEILKAKGYTIVDEQEDEKPKTSRRKRDQ